MALNSRQITSIVEGIIGFSTAIAAAIYGSIKTGKMNKQADEILKHQDEGLNKEGEYSIIKQRVEDISQAASQAVNAGINMLGYALQHFQQASSQMGSDREESQQA